jgi:hypothetical protein
MFWKSQISGARGLACASSPPNFDLDCPQSSLSPRGSIEKFKV